MNHRLTIVVPTRDRIDLLKLALASIYERQTLVPPVIVSDNSTRDDAEMDSLRHRYGFTYVRQTGQVPLTEHHNACLAMPSTPWVWLLHDDDEIVPGAVAEIESVLADCGDVGIIVGGVEYITWEGHAHWWWMPVAGKMRGEEAMKAIGLDWQARAPSQLFSVEAAKRLGGYANTAGLTGDYAFAVLMAKEFGVAFHPKTIGRFRSGHPHAADFYSTPEGMDRYLEFFHQQARVIARSDCSRELAAELADFLMWHSLRHLLNLHGPDVPDLARKIRLCSQGAPGEGAWRNRVREEFPILFWRPTWFWQPLFRTAVLASTWLKRLSGGKSEILSNAIRPLVFQRAARRLSTQEQGARRGQG